MNFSAFHEQKFRGSFDFPVELHYVEQGHPKYEMPFHWHSEYEFLLVLDGFLNLSLDGNEMPLKKGDVALISGGVVHGGTPKGCIYECMVVDILSLLESNKTFQNLFDGTFNTDVPIISKYACGCNISKLADRMFEAMETEYAGYELTVTGLLFQILGEVVKEHTALSPSDIPDDCLKRIKQLKSSLRFIHKNYSGTVTLSSLANEAGMSPKYFCRFFKEMVNRTPIDYLNFYRIERACQSLTDSEKSVTEIALDCGFNDLSYFIKTFKKHKGISPKQYKKSVKK